jgi:hypothetical protein
MPSWFDLLTLDATGPEDEAGIKKVQNLFNVCLAHGVISLSVPRRRYHIRHHRTITVSLLSNVAKVNNTFNQISEMEASAVVKITMSYIY